MYASALFSIGGVPRVPLGTHGNFDLAVPINILRGNADIVLERKVFKNQVLGPFRVAVPDKLFLVGEEDIRFSVPVDITDGYTVADGDLVIDDLGFEGGIRLQRDRNHNDE